MSKAQNTKAKIGKSKADFRAAHDKDYIVPQKINSAIQKLGADGWEYELTFLRLAEISTTELGAYREQFEDFIVVVGGKNPKRCWCGSKELANELRKMV